MAEVVVFDIDAASAIQKLAQLRADTTALKEAQKQLADEVKKGNKEAATSYEANAIILKNLANEQRNLSRQVEGYAQVQKDATDTTNFANNSIQQNRDLLKQLTAQYINLKNPSAQATKQIKDLSDTLKQQESAIGDNRRSVGSYKEAISSAFNELKVGNVQVGQLSQSISASKNAFQAAGGGVKGFSAALATTGIPIVIMAVQQLINVFSAFKPVADAVEDVVNGLAAGFKAFIDGNDIGEAVKQSNALLNTIRDLEDTQNAFNIAQAKSKNEIDRLIIASKDRTKTEEERLAALEKAEQLEKELFNNQVERNETLAKQQEKTLMQQLKLSKEELKILATSDNANDEYYQKIKARAEANTAFDEEALKKYQDTLKERANLEGESLKFTEKRTNERNKLIEKEEEEQEKAAQKQKERLEKLKQEREKYEQDIANLSSQFLNTDREKLVKSFEDKLEIIKGFSKKEIKLRIEILEQQQKALEEFDKKVALDNQKKAIEEFTTGVQKELELLDLQQEGRRDFLIQSGLTEAEITEKFRKERLAVIDKFAQKEIDANLKVAEENLRIQEEYNEKQRELAFALAEAEREITFQRIDIASQAANLLSGIVGEQSVISNLALIVQKSAAIADIIVQTQAANAAARANVSLYPPFVPNPLGLPIPSPAFVKALVLSQAQVTRNNIQAGIAVATIGAQTIQQVAPKFAEGGEISINGKSHAQGGEVVTIGGRPVAEVEGGEGLYVMKKNAYQAIKQFSAINEAFGGKSWLKGSSKYLADGGAINATLPAMESRNRVNSTLEQNRLLAQAIKQIPAPVLSIKEFETKQAIKDKSVRVSEL